MVQKVNYSENRTLGCAKRKPSPKPTQQPRLIGDEADLSTNISHTASEKIVLPECGGRETYTLYCGSRYPSSTLISIKEYININCTRCGVLVNNVILLFYVRYFIVIERNPLKRLEHDYGGQQNLLKRRHQPTRGMGAKNK